MSPRHRFRRRLPPRLRFRWRYRLGVRTEDSQSSNPGSIPGSATTSYPSSTFLPDIQFAQKRPQGCGVELDLLGEALSGAALAGAGVHAQPGEALSELAQPGRAGANLGLYSCWHKVFWTASDGSIIRVRVVEKGRRAGGNRRCRG